MGLTSSTLSTKTTLPTNRSEPGSDAEEFGGFRDQGLGVGKEGPAARGCIACVPCHFFASPSPSLKPDTVCSAGRASIPTRL